MLPEGETVDFAAVRLNAKEEGIPLSEIAIFYRGLTEDEITTLGSLVTHRNGEVTIAKFPTDEKELFPNKAFGVYSLSA